MTTCDIPHHPANPKTHERAVAHRLCDAMSWQGRAEQARSVGRHDRAALSLKFSRSQFELAAESAEEVATLTGMKFSILPGATERNVHNDLWGRWN